MDRFGLGLLKNQQDAAQQARSVNIHIYDGGQFNKRNASDFLDAIYVELTSSQTSPISKTMTLHVLKQMTYQAQSKFFSLFASHKLLDFLANEAKTIDPKKNMVEKGSSKFPNNSQVGRQYTRLLLQLINFWGQKFAKGGKSGEPTKYKKILVDLKNLGVTLPANTEIFNLDQYKLKTKKMKQSGPTPSGQHDNLNMGKNKQGLKSGAQPGKLMSELQYTKEKINIFVDQMDQIQDADKLQNLIKTNHTFFEKQRSKYQGRQSQIQPQNIDMVVDFTSVYHILEQQNKLYNQCSLTNDWAKYIYEFKVQVEKTFPNAKDSLSYRPPQKTQPNRPSASNAYNVSNVYNSSNVNSLPPQTAASRTNRISQNQDVKSILTNALTRIQQKSKSPSSGFRAVQIQMEKEKQLAKKNPIRRTSKSPRNLGRSGQGGLNKSTASNLRQSKIHPIFTSPPNPSIGYKAYEGELVGENRELTSALFSLKKEQGSRRFKVSNFRQKNPLFENQQIQVGYKSQAVFEQINDFNHFILLNIFIGNKTQEVIKQFQVEYKGDNNQLLYANPKSVDSIIPAGYQNKHDLMITPLHVPYNLMTMHIRYRFKETGYMTSIILPNSVLKFASYMKISKSDFDSQWRTSTKLKTNSFSLCRQLAPDSFHKWIPVLQSITKYSQFSKQGSETDLQMFCGVIMLQKHEGVLKINVRPNLDVVLQLGVLDNNQEGLEYFKFYLQTLELMLKEIDV